MQNDVMHFSHWSPGVREPSVQIASPADAGSAQTVRWR